MHQIFFLSKRTEKWFNLIEHIICWALIVYKAFCVRCYQEEQNSGKNTLTCILVWWRLNPKSFFLLYDSIKEYNQPWGCLKGGGRGEIVVVERLVIGTLAAKIIWKPGLDNISSGLNACVKSLGLSRWGRCSFLNTFSSLYFILGL